MMGVDNVDFMIKAHAEIAIHLANNCLIYLLGLSNKIPNNSSEALLKSLLNPKVERHPEWQKKHTVFLFLNNFTKNIEIHCLHIFYEALYAKALNAIDKCKELGFPNTVDTLELVADYVENGIRRGYQRIQVPINYE